MPLSPVCGMRRIVASGCSCKARFHRRWMRCWYLALRLVQRGLRITSRPTSAPTTQQLGGHMQRVRITDLQQALHGHNQS